MKNVLIALTLVPWLVALTPYEHDGSSAVVVDGQVARGRALFSTEAAADSSRVLVYTDFPLPNGNEGYLTIELPLGPAGSQPVANFVYYEKSGPDSVVFDSGNASGVVVIGDRYSVGDETSLYLEFDVKLNGQGGSRHLQSGWAVTAPSPSILRTEGLIPDGVVILDDGSGAYTGRAYDRGSVDCYGYPSEVVLIESYHDDIEFVDEHGDPLPEPIVKPDPLPGPDPVGPTGGVDSYSESPGCNDRDTTSDDDSSSSSDEEFASCNDSDADSSSSTTSDSGCFGDSDSSSSSSSSDDSGCSDSDSSSSSSSSDDSGCSGDAEAASGPRRFVRFHRGPPAWARRVLQLSPLLMGIVVMLLARERLIPRLVARLRKARSLRSSG